MFHTHTHKKHSQHQLICWIHFRFNGERSTYTPENMSTAIMQSAVLGWDYKAYDWNSAPNEIAEMSLKVSVNNIRTKKKRIAWFFPVVFRSFVRFVYFFCSCRSVRMWDFEKFFFSLLSFNFKLCRLFIWAYLYGNDKNKMFWL